MKKLFVTFIGLSLIYSSQATAVNWQIDWGVANAGLPAYCFVPSVRDDVLSAIEMMSGTELQTTLNGLATDDQWYGNLSKRAGRLTLNGEAVPWQVGDHESLMMVVFTDPTFAKGSTFWYDDFDTADYSYAPPGTPPAQLNVHQADFTKSGTVNSAPEPSSALLLFLGMAALGLKRKVA